jgi:tryptophan synthase alpha chain
MPATAAPTSRIADAFAAAKRENRLAFMPFVAGGDPDLATTIDVIRELGRRGVDLIEVGVPYSDPIADGPVVQAAYTRALDAGFKLDDFFKAFADLHQSPNPNSPIPPLVAMVSFSIVYRVGTERFARKAIESGFAGLIVPDLPGDEAAEFAATVRAAGLGLIELVSPLTPPQRVRRIVANCSGFVYCIAVAGTTGERDQLPAALAGQLERLRHETDLPLAVGFGVSRPEHVNALRGKADGAIVGSALVRRFERFADQPREAVLREIGEYAGQMAAACR